MKKFLVLSFFSFIFIIPKADAQAWNPIGLDVVGHNTKNGVEAWWQLGTCSGDDAVFVKLINNNNYTVNIEWFPAVFTNNLQWIKKETPADKKSIDVNPNSTAAGDCTSQTMMVLLKDFPVVLNDFIKFGAVNFSVNPK